MIEFNNIDELYSYLESDSNTLESNWELTNVIRRLADTAIDKTLKEKIKWECFAFDFDLKNGKVDPIHSSTKEDGTTIYAYPSFNDFGEKGIAYLIERSKTVKSHHLIARYNQILWNSYAPFKHQEQAKKAIDVYLKILNNLNWNKEEKKEGWNRLEIMKNGFRLSLQLKYEVDSYKTILRSWLFEKNKFPKDSKIFILKFMLDLTQLKKVDFNGSLELVKQLGIEINKKKPDYFFIKEIYETGLKIAQRTGNDTKIWNKRIGDAIVSMAHSRMDDESRMIPLSLFKEAIPYYKLAGLTKKVKEVEHRYFELKKELKLSKFEVPLEDEAADALDEYLKNKTAKLLEYKPEDIFGYLLNGTDIFPERQWLIRMGKDKDSAFLDFATAMRFDINNNVSKEKDTKDAKAKGKIYQNYHLYINLTVLPLLHRIFIEGIRIGKINFKSLIQFIAKNTWLGQELTDCDSGGDLIKYQWISLIAPSLHEYFLQTESALKSNNPYTTYIMPIDSLTLKFEGVLRDFAKLINVSTTVTGKGDILREKYIEEMLAEKEIQKYFNENDLLFFNFLFVAKEGMNLRNNIAHSFYRFNNYNFQIMHLLICAFLRIGKYKISVTKTL
jgi:hypothetical protein